MLLFPCKIWIVQFSVARGLREGFEAGIRCAGHGGVGLKANGRAV